MLKHTANTHTHTNMCTHPFPGPRYMKRWQAALCGMIIKLDHSFKVVKRVRDATAHKQFSAVLTVMNEFCQVRWCDGDVSTGILFAMGVAPRKQSASTHPHLHD